jgi:thymidylate synthase (FAD)
MYDDVDNGQLHNFRIYSIGHESVPTPLNIMHNFKQDKVITNGDRLILKAARVSTKSNNNGMTNQDRDKKLLRYLWEKKHTSVFEQVTYQFVVVMPLYIAEQWKRHRTWHMNQESLRYREQDEGTIEFEKPEWHYQNTEGNKQGGDLLIENKALLDALNHGFNDDVQVGLTRYRYAIEAGVAKEDARRFLPVSMMTTCMFTVDLKNLTDFVFKRCDPAAQREIRVLAYIIKNKMIKMLNPWVHELIDEAFTKSGWPLEYE